MKNIKLLPVIIVIASVLLSACGSLTFQGLSPATVATVPSAPATTAAQSAPVTSVPATSAPAAPLSSTGQNIQAGSPVTSAPPAVGSQAATDVAALQSAYESVFQAVNPSVVTIEISSQVSSNNNGGLGGGGQNNQGSQGQIVPTAQGSGFIWDSAGHIVTNNHVVTGAAKITVTFSNGATYDAKLVGTDPNTDLAVIQVTGAPADLIKPITQGDSTQVKVGEFVVAIGNPYGLGNTMTTGIVSAIGRSIQASLNNSQSGATTTTPSFSIPDVIQTDAAINPGNSGGVLVDMNGAVVGVPSQLESASGANSGVGFAIPISIVKTVAPQLISKGVAAHSYLGISGATVTADIVSSLNLKSGQTGILVASVVAGGPADKAGLQAATADANGNPTSAGDIIVGIDGKTIATFEDLVSYLSNNTQPGQVVTLTVLRNGHQTQLKVTLGTQPTN